MNHKQRIATALTALTFAATGPTTTPANAASAQCRGYNVNMRGTGANETFQIYPDRVEIHNRSILYNLPITIKRKPRQPIVIDTGTGNDTITAHDNVDFIACFQKGKRDGSDRLKKQGGNADVFFAGDGNFSATGGDNHVHIRSRGTATTGAGRDFILIEGNGTVSSAGGDNHIVVEGNGEVHAGIGNDNIHIEGSGEIYASGGDDIIAIERTGRVTGDAGDDLIYVGGQATINAGSGNDIIVTKQFDDSIITGPGDDRVNAGEGNDTCDPTWRNSPSKGDIYQGCETIYGR